MDVSDLVKELQIMLRLTGFLGPNIEIDGIYSDFVLRAAQKFQKQFNRDESSSLGSVSENSDLTKLLEPSESSSESLSLWPTLAEDGRVSKDILDKLRNHLKELLGMFRKVGYEVPTDYFNGHIVISTLILKFQVIPSFSLSFVLGHLTTFFLFQQNSKKLVPTASFSDKTIELIKSINMQLLASKRKQ